MYSNKRKHFHTTELINTPTHIKLQTIYTFIIISQSILEYIFFIVRKLIIFVLTTLIYLFILVYKIISYYLVD